MVFVQKSQKPYAPLDTSRAKTLYFMNFANYGNMKRNGEYEEYMGYHISEALEKEWSRMIMDDLAAKIRNGEEVWRVADLADIRIDESAIVNCFQDLAKSPNAPEIYAATEKAGSLIAPDLLKRIQSVLLVDTQNCNIEGVQRP